MSEIELIKEITAILQCHHLTGRAMGDCCTDGFDVEYVLLAQKIVNLCTEET